ncbi:MAG: hypothetical protein ACD_72C00090G0002 [uncultured bacterium]|nr:MAG: hypothetical protein ACD_72C00090G0002 [uncultured bacterium]
MNKNSAKLFAAQIGAEIPSLDLHGLYPDQALEKLDFFIYQCVEQNADSARVIYGGGTGRLRDAVLEKIKTYSIILECYDEGGSCIIIF